MAAAAGIVMTQAMMIPFATPQRTALNRCVAPEPMIAEVSVWVVETGACRPIAMTYRTPAPAASAAKPFGGAGSTIRRPQGREIRQPPAEVSAAHAGAAG